MWMQCAFGVMLGSELIWKRLKRSGKALIVTTLTQSLGTFAFVSIAFGIVFAIVGVPIYPAFVFGGIVLATAPAPAVSIVKEFHSKGPVTDTLLPMTVLDDVVYESPFFHGKLSDCAGSFRRSDSNVHDPGHDLSSDCGWRCSWISHGAAAEKGRRKISKTGSSACGITVTMVLGWLLNTYVLSGVALNYTLMGVAFSAVFSNMITAEQVEELNGYFSPVLGISLLAVIVDLGAPLLPRVFAFFAVSIPVFNKKHL